MARRGWEPVPKTLLQMEEWVRLGYKTSSLLFRLYLISDVSDRFPIGNRTLSGLVRIKNARKLVMDELVPVGFVGVYAQNGVEFGVLLVPSGITFDPATDPLYPEPPSDLESIRQSFRGVLNPGLVPQGSRARTRTRSGPARTRVPGRTRSGLDETRRDRQDGTGARGYAREGQPAPPSSSSTKWVDQLYKAGRNGIDIQKLGQIEEGNPDTFARAVDRMVADPRPWDDPDRDLLAWLLRECRFVERDGDADTKAAGSGGGGLPDPTEAEEQLERQQAGLPPGGGYQGPQRDIPQVKE